MHANFPGLALIPVCSLAVLLGASLPSVALPGPGPGEPFGGENSGCVPTTKSRLSCSVALGKAYDKLEAALLKCHGDEVKSLYFELSGSGGKPFDETLCRSRAIQRFDDRIERLGQATCVSSPGFADVIEDRDALLVAIESEKQTPWCDDTSGVATGDIGWVPANPDGLRCGSKTAKGLRALSSRMRRCHRVAADKGFRLADPPYDVAACEGKFLGKFQKIANKLEASGRCAPCFAAAAQAALASDLDDRLSAANETVFACPDPVLAILETVLDRPTPSALGLQLLISGDENYDAFVTVRYREAGAGVWKDGPALMRVRPEDTKNRVVPHQFAGSIFDLRPATNYEIELSAVDADGPVNETILVEAQTRALPTDPLAPNLIPIANEAEFRTALSSASPGDILELADGVYPGPFVLDSGGSADNPVVIRGASRDGTILDGGGCDACNVLEVYGSFIHVERLTLRNANRALRFQTAGAEGCVASRLRSTNTRLGFGARDGQRDFYICDNLLEGRLVWPHVYFDDDGIHSSDDGILIYGDGHVVCHNEISGFGDGIKNGERGARAVDIYGNEITSAYDNGIELDFGEGNVRALRNRMTNNFAPLSFQPLYGGPAYAIRNVAVNLTHEQLKFHGVGGGSGPSGVLVWNNTFVAPDTALFMATNATSHWFEFANNLFVGPETPPGRVADWTGPINNGVFDDDGWFPDGAFRFAIAGETSINVASFSELQSEGFEINGRILQQPIFATGLVAPASYTQTLAPQDVSLDPTSNALDAARLIPGINDTFMGAGPDLGALENGCSLPIYGIRPEGINESNQVFGCGP